MKPLTNIATDAFLGKLIHIQMAEIAFALKIFIIPLELLVQISFENHITSGFGNFFYMILTFARIKISPNIPMKFCALGRVKKLLEAKQESDRNNTSRSCE